ncbi:hypothetical protein Hanom_Chr03g00190111 [Helianthus anomalus]
MLEELGLDDGKFKFDIDIEDEIPLSPEKEYEFKYAHEADNFHYVEVEDCSDSSEEDTPFHYSGIDDSFPTLAEMFKEQNEDEGVQYFEFLSDIKTLPLWDVEELFQTKNIKQFYHGLDVKQHDQHLWNYIKLQAKERFPAWKPQFPEQDINIDPVTGRKTSL